VREDSMDSQTLIVSPLSHDIDFADVSVVRVNFITATLVPISLILITRQPWVSICHTFDDTKNSIAE